MHKTRSTQPMVPVKQLHIPAHFRLCVDPFFAILLLRAVQRHARHAVLDSSHTFTLQWRPICPARYLIILSSHLCLAPNVHKYLDSDTRVTIYCKLKMCSLPLQSLSIARLLHSTRPHRPFLQSSPSMKTSFKSRQNAAILLALVTAHAATGAPLEEVSVQHAARGVGWDILSDNQVTVATAACTRCFAAAWSKCHDANGN